LILTEYLLKNGNTKFCSDMKVRKEIFIRLQEYKYYENNMDMAEDVRRHAAKVLELLDDEEMLERERGTANSIRGKIYGYSNMSHGFLSEIDNKNNSRVSLADVSDEDFKEFSDSEEEEVVHSPVEKKRSSSRKANNTKVKKSKVKEYISEPEFYEDEKEDDFFFDNDVYHNTTAAATIPNNQLALVSNENPFDVLLENTYLNKSSKEIDMITGIEFDNNLKNGDWLFNASNNNNHEENKPVSSVDLFDSTFTSSHTQTNKSKMIEMYGENDAWSVGVDMVNFNNLMQPISQVRDMESKKISKSIESSKPKLNDLKTDHSNQIVMYGSYPTAYPNYNYYYGYTHGNNTAIVPYGSMHNNANNASYPYYM